MRLLARCCNGLEMLRLFEEHCKPAAEPPCAAAVPPQFLSIRSLARWKQMSKAVCRMIQMPVTQCESPRRKIAEVSWSFAQTSPAKPPVRNGIYTEGPADHNLKAILSPQWHEDIADSRLPGIRGSVRHVWCLQRPSISSVCSVWRLFELVLGLSAQLRDGC